jgi:hypothetical protein
LADSLQAFNSNREPLHAKLREPDTFTGQDPQKLQAFLMQCHFQFHNCPAAFHNDVQKINFALSYLCGKPSNGSNLVSPDNLMIHLLGWMIGKSSSRS